MLAMILTKIRNYLRFNGAPKSKDSILVTDIVFPNRYAMWRIAETTSFMQEKAADFLVFRADSYGGISFDVDYEEMVVNKGFKDYNILIFDPKYNYLNRYNSRIDGTNFNGMIKASYLISRHEEFNINFYGFVYHIFLMCYEIFNSNFFYPKERQAVHLYPGGGNLGPDSAKTIHRETRVISTHPNTTSSLSNLGHRNYIECLGGTFLTNTDHPFPEKSRNDDILRIAFASMGRNEEKGAGEFVLLSRRFQEAHPDSCVEFVSIGKEPLGEGIRHYPPMGVHELLKLYHNHIDIMVSMDTGIAFNGWPLGMEAALCGCVLATTDPHNVHAYYGFSPDSVFVFDIEKLSDLIDFIHRLDVDRVLLRKHSVSCQSEIQELLSYSIQQKKIFNYINI